jgi:hypothetical protein
VRNKGSASEGLALYVHEVAGGLSLIYNPAKITFPTYLPPSASSQLASILYGPIKLSFSLIFMAPTLSLTSFIFLTPFQRSFLCGGTCKEKKWDLVTWTSPVSLTSNEDSFSKIQMSPTHYVEIKHGGIDWNQIILYGPSFGAISTTRKDSDNMVVMTRMEDGRLLKLKVKSSHTQNDA